MVEDDGGDSGEEVGRMRWQWSCVVGGRVNAVGRNGYVRIGVEFELNGSGVGFLVVGEG